MSGGLQLERRGEEVRFAVRVQPRASRCRIAGVHDGALKVLLTAPPIEDRANRQLLHFLASELGIPRSSVRLVSGAKSRRKNIAVKGLDELSPPPALKAYLL